MIQPCFLVALLLATAPATQDTRVAPSAPQDARSPAQATTRYVAYDVRDLLDGWVSAGVTSAPRPAEERLGADASAESAIERAAREESLLRMAQLQAELRLKESTGEFAEMLKTYMKPEFDGRSQRIDVLSAGTIVAQVTDGQHAWLDEFLRRQRTTTDTIEIEVRYFVVKRGAFRVLGERASWVYATRAEADAALAKLPPDMNVLSAPRVLCRNLQATSVSTVNEVAYVKDYEIRFVEPGDSAIADPIIDVIQEGLFLNSRAFELAAGAYGLSLETTKVDVKRPIRTTKRRIAAWDGRDVEIALPEVERVRFRADVTLVEGGSALFVAADNDDDRDLALLVTVRRGPPVAPQPTEPK